MLWKWPEIRQGKWYEARCAVESGAVEMVRTVSLEPARSTADADTEVVFAAGKRVALGVTHRTGGRVLGYDGPAVRIC